MPASQAAHSCDVIRDLRGRFVLNPSSLAVVVFVTILSATPRLAAADQTPLRTPDLITTGPDGNLWFTEGLASRIGRITPLGVVSEFAMLDPKDVAFGMTAGPDGALWFVLASPPAQTASPEPAYNEMMFLTYTGKVGRITAAGKVTEFALPRNVADWPSPNIIAGPDGDLWMAGLTKKPFQGVIIRVTTGGIISAIARVPQFHSVDGLCTGPDGSVWFFDRQASKIWRINRAGAISEFAIPSKSWPTSITAGPDGNVWVAETRSSEFSSIGRITPAGTITEIPIPGPHRITGIVAGADGNLWFSAYQDNAIGRITTAGVITEFSTPALRPPTSITAGPDGNLWFTQYNSIGRITTSGTITEFPLPPKRHD